MDAAECQAKNDTGGPFHQLTETKNILHDAPDFSKEDKENDSERQQPLARRRDSKFGFFLIGATLTNSLANGYSQIMTVFNVECGPHNHAFHDRKKLLQPKPHRGGLAHAKEPSVEQSDIHAREYPCPWWQC